MSAAMEVPALLKKLSNREEFQVNQGAALAKVTCDK